MCRSRESCCSRCGGYAEKGRNAPVFDLHIFCKRENEENIAYLLQERPDMELLMPEWDEYFSHGKRRI